MRRRGAGDVMTITRRELLAGAALLPAARAFAWIPERPRPRDIAEAALLAARRAGATYAERRPIQLAPEPPHEDTWETPVEKDPLRVPVSAKVALLVEAAKAARSAVPQVRAVTGLFRLAVEEKAFFSSEGSAIEQMMTRTT